MNSAGVKAKNWDVLHEFLAHWERPANLQGNDQLAIVLCRVAYCVGGNVRHVATRADVYVKSGRVLLGESVWLTAEDFYTEFDVKWQTFSLTPSKALRIEGKGPKIRGPYWVEITPT